MTWTDGWPRITAPGEAIANVHKRPALKAGPKPAVPTSGPFTVMDAFDGPELPPNWMMMRNPRERWHAFENGGLMLTPRKAGIGDNANPSFLARRQQHLDATATTVVQFQPRRDGDRAGLVALQNDDFWAFIGIARQDGVPMIVVDTRAGPDQPATGNRLYSAPLGGQANMPVYLRIAAKGRHYSLAWSFTRRRWKTVATIDGTILSTKVAGGFVGSVFGVYAKKGD